MKRLLNFWRRKNPTRKHDTLVKTEIRSMSSQPQSRRLYVAIGKEVRVLVASDGSLETILKCHKDSINAIDVSKDGKWLVTGGADKTTILWSTSDFSVQMKTYHKEPIQCTKFSSTDRLLVCSSHEFMLWRSDSKKLQRSKLSRYGSKIMCCAWNDQGTRFALGMYNGLVSIRNIEGVENSRIDRSANFPVWTLSFIPDVDEDEERLVISDGRRILSFYSQDGSAYFGDKYFGFKVSTIAEFGRNKKFLLVGGSEGQAKLVSCEGVELANLCEQASWIRSVCYHESSGYAILGTTDAVLAAYQVNYRHIDAFSSDRMAVVKNMTDIHLYHFASGQEATLKCRDLIEGIAFWKGLFAVQLTQRLLFYAEKEDDHDTRLQYRIQWKIPLRRGFRFLLITDLLVWLTEINMLSACDFSGETKSTWEFNSKISGACALHQTEMDTILVSLEDGDIYRIVSCNFQPQFLFKHDGLPISIHLSVDESKIALIDDARILSIYSMFDYKILFQHSNVSGILWNIDMPDIFGYFIGTQVFIQMPNIKAFDVSIRGSPCSFQGNRLYCFDGSDVTSYEIKYDRLAVEAIQGNQLGQAFESCISGISG